MFIRTNRAVESGDVEEAQDYLEGYKTDVDTSDESGDERDRPTDKTDKSPKPVSDEDEKLTLEVRANGKKPARAILKKAKDKTTVDTNDSATIIEMDSLDTATSPTETKPSVASRWAVAKRQKRASKVHIPVITTTRPSSRKGKKLHQKSTQGSDTRKFNKNCRDEWGRSALFIAMLNRDKDMMKMLLAYKVN